MKGMKYGHYQILYKLGEGKDSICYFAINTNNKKEYCLKVIPIQRDQKTKKSRIMIEIECLKKLNEEENIVKYHESFKVNDAKNRELICISMEMMPMTLSEYLYRKNEKFSEKLTKKIVRNLCIALLTCHDKLIVHNDIKPENIAIDPRSHTIKILGKLSI
eukprot:TRINITY_DN632_c0_g1_i2.p1 TRINITY_DN632_c0_g1~~TRINITY_DN632_c0_g1_i2.p1  ORF type:complete len:161 (-),score=29.33 TRINITY_DN632_c0_g1_i2:517-999(-)